MTKPKTLLILIFILIIVVYAFLQNNADLLSFNRTRQMINQKLINPMKQFLTDRNIKEESQEFLDKAEETVEQKQEELVDKTQEKVKQEIKDGAKNWLGGKLELVKKGLTPLKNKLQEGRCQLREQVNKLKNYLSGWWEE
ncbi:MAG: hypothetical protein AVO34_02135 [Firmicutes bacterium ML8_F2]|jgi:predicted Holliday junction resolvase-like endonuclease|nr:MAG: hypothetical protein AVO34_02135 [Firmicutes bacterium ML8_F2]